MTAPRTLEIVSLRPSLVLFLWDGFTSANTLAGAVNVQIGGTLPLFQNERSGFVFPNLADGSYTISVQSAPDEPYYLPVDIPVTLPFPRPADTLWPQAPAWSAYPDIVLADPSELLEDPDQTPAYLGQRALATLLPSTGYPFPPGATLLRGVVTSDGKALSGALVTTSPLAQPGRYSVLVLDETGVTSNAQTLSVMQGPFITSIDPAAVITDSGGFILLIYGSGFMPGAVVQWNGGALPTEFLNADSLAAQVRQSQVLAAGSASIVAVNPNGRASNPLAFNVAAAPVILSIDPQTVTAGSDTFTLAVTGSGFVPDAHVILAGVAVETEFVASTELNAQVTAAQIASATPLSVLVMTPGQLRQSSNVKTLSVVSEPVINSLEPPAVMAGSQAFTLTLSGSGFVTGATVQIGATTASTQFLGANQLAAQVTAGQVVSTGQLSVSVMNPNGARSGTQSLATLASPVITALNPDLVSAGYSAFSLVVRGSGYASHSAVELNGIPLSTAFISSTELHTHVPRNGYATGDDGTFVLFFDSLRERAQTFTLMVSHPNYSDTKSVSVAVIRGATASIQIDMGS